MQTVARALSLALVLWVRQAGAQDWQTGHQVEVIRRAAEARASRDADTVLAGWQASAHGIVRFTAEVDHGNGPIERVIRADELRVEVYGEAPNRSKQVIVAWRDTTFQPTGIVYHRDHLGIIANDFGPTIRLGEGEEVRDVPHPLSSTGLGWYHFRVGDTLVVSASTGSVRVVSVEVRPVDPTSPGIVGVMLLDTDRAALVRLTFTFTGAAYRDPTVADISVALENALHEDARWLPWRQSIAIRRAAPLMVLPLATVIRADWTIEDYRLGLRHPAERFAGFAIDGPRRPLRDRGWTTPWTVRPDSLPGSQSQLVWVTRQATGLVRRDLLEGLPRLRLLADGGVSRLLHINRVQGVTLGAGLRWRGPQGLTADLAGAVGTSDGRLTGTGTVSWPVAGLRMRTTGAREIRDLHEWSRRSGVANSLATLLDGSDAGDWYLSRRFEVGVEWLPAPATTIRASLRRESTEPVISTFAALDGTRLTNPVLGNGTDDVLRFEFSSVDPEGRGFQLSMEHGRSGADEAWWRAVLQAAGTLPARLEWRLLGGVGDRHLPTHRGFSAGGAGSLPGTVPRAIGGRQLWRVELARPIRVVLPSPLSRRIGGHQLASWLVPFVAAGLARGKLDGVPWPGSGELVPVAGLRLDLWGPSLRAEAGWAPRSGGFSIAIDAHPDWWPML